MAEVDAFVFFKSFYEGAKELDDADRLAFYDAIIEYAFNGDASPATGVAKACFSFVKPVLDKSKNRAEAGRKGGRASRGTPEDSSEGKEDLPHSEPENKQTLSKPEANPKQNESKPEANSENREAIKDKGLGIKDKGLGIKEDKGIIAPNSSGGSLGSVAKTPAAPSSVISLPLASGEGYSVSEDDVTLWSGLYPAVDILQELRKMAGWLDSNPRRRKTARGIRQFITSWLAREQDRGRARASPEVKSRSYDIRELEELSQFDLPENL